MKTCAFVVAAVLASPALADSIDLDYQSIAGGSFATTLSVDGQQQRAGYLFHEITSGSQAGQTFGTFCIELAEQAQNGSATYEIVDIADAPNPGTPFGQSVEDAVSAIVANAAALGWINTNLTTDQSQSGFLGKMGAIQAAIWEATGFSINLNSSQTSDELSFYYGVLMSNATFDPSLRVNGLRAAVAADNQDVLYVVPLPPAAFAGAGLLLAGFGIRAYRRR